MNFKSLNININGVPAPGFAGDDDIFNTVAVRIGAVLPEDYIEFIKAVDGGHPEFGSFRLRNEAEESWFTVEWFYTFSNPRIENIEAALDSWNEKLGEMTLPIARDGGGNQFFLNLSEPVPSVWIYLHDEGDTKVKLAESLEEFLSALTVNPDFI